MATGGDGGRMTDGADRPLGDAGNPIPLAGHPAVHEPADPPRTGSITFWAPDGGVVPDDAVRLTVAAPTAHDTHPGGAPATAGPVRQRTVPARRVPIAEAIPMLLAGTAPGRAAHPAVAFWALATRLALRLVASRRLVPTVSPAGFDAWRIGPLHPDDLAQIRRLTAAIPPPARAVPVPGTDPPHLPDAWPLLRGYLDAVADTLPRTPAAATGAGGDLFAATTPRPVPGPGDWAEEITAELDAAVRISLRLETTDDPAEGAGLRGVLQVHSLTDPALVADARTLWVDTPRPAAGFGTRARIETALAVRRAARVWPPLTPLLDEAVPDTLTLADQEISELLDGAAARLAAAGVEVRWPRDLAPTMTARAVLTGGPPPAGGPSPLGQGWQLRLDWELTLGGDPLTPAEMDLFAEAHRPVVRLRDRWMLIEPDLARRARDRSLKPLTPLHALGAALTGSTEVDGDLVAVAATGWIAELRERLARPDTGPESLTPPAGLTATLRDYQLRGLRWLTRMTALGLGGCLADDMGLGKTVTLIALHLRRQSDPETAGPTLVVCPASLLGNWEREIERFAPGVPVSRFHGSGRSVQPAPDGFLLTTYATMRLDAARLAETRWGLLVADEAQHVKNPTSGTARALRRIDAAARVALTGTPVENNLSELWAILDWTTPGLLGPLGTFRRRWADPVQGGDPAAAQRLGRLIAPFLLRRRKSDPGVGSTYGSPNPGWPAGPPNWSCSTSCSTRSAPPTAPSWSSPSTWRWPGCCAATSTTGATATSCCMAAPRWPDGRSWSTTSRPAPCRSSCSP